MSKLPTVYLRKKTQTGVSAFFRWDRPRIVSVSYGICIALLLATALPASGRVLEEKKPAVQLKGVAIERLDWSSRTAETRLSIAIDNPGAAFTLKDIAYRLMLNDIQAAEGKCPKNITVPAHSSVTFDVPCSVDLSTVPGIAWKIIAGGFDIHYQLETEFTVPLFGEIGPRLKTSIAGDLSLSATVTGWTARIKDQISGR